MQEVVWLHVFIVQGLLEILIKNKAQSCSNVLSKRLTAVKVYLKTLSLSVLP